MSEQDATVSPGREDFPLPPPTFEFLVISLRMQAEAHLGLLYHGDDEKAEPDLRMGRHAIDLLGMIQEKTKGNLSFDEQRLLDNSLTELRFRYLESVKLDANRRRPDETGTPPASES